METIIRDLCESGTLEYSVSVLAANDRPRTVRESRGGVFITRVARWASIWSVPLAPGLYRELRRVPADVVILHEPNPIAAFCVLLVRPKAALIIWVHSEVVRQRALCFLYNFVLRRLFVRASRIVVATPRHLSHMRILTGFQHKVAVVPYGIDPDSYSSQASFHDVSGCLGVKERNEGTVLFVGRLVYYKGVDILLQAMTKIRGCLIVVGDGPLRDRLCRLAERYGIADRTLFVGRVSHENLMAYYHACDVFVLPSINEAEAFGLVQLEAMACGKPVVSTDLPTGVPWVNVDGETGFIVPPGNPEAMAGAIQRLLDNPELRRSTGESGRRRVQTLFTKNRTVEEVNKLVTEVSKRLSSRDSRGPGSSTGLASKRVLDVLLSGLGLLISAPVWILAAALVKLEDGGPVFHPQERVGKDGKRFKSWKFRSMGIDSDAKYGPLQAGENDQRVTRVGRLLRATALDELPQLWSIFRGDMSFVGPRALLAEEIEVRCPTSNVQSHEEPGRHGEVVPLEKIPGYEERHRVRPGLTGLAQVHAPRDIPRRHKFKYDLLYIKRQSFWLDLKLIALSFLVSFFGKWENRRRKLPGWLMRPRRKQKRRESVRRKA